MKFKQIIPFILLCSAPFATQSVYAGEVTGQVDLTKVTLFLQGAELQGTASVNVTKGESEILLTNLANNINLSSINVGLGNKAMILSTTLVDNYLVKKTESEQLKSLQVSLKQLEDEQATLNIKLVAVNTEIALLEGNRIEALTKSNGSLTEAKQAINFIKDNLVNALTEQLALQTELNGIKNHIAQYQSQISLETGSNDRPQKAIKVKIYTDQASTLPITLSYITPDAGWEPLYDVRVKDIDSPVILTYKAKVYQYSGLSWNNIDFTLSTANPSQGITAPNLTPWHISLYDEKSAYGGKSNSSSYMVMEQAISPTMSKDMVAKQSKNNFTDYVVTNNNGLNIQYNIKLPYTILGYSNDNILMLKNKEVAADYRYVATPKLDDNAFLQAQITDWDKLSLLAGKSTIFFDGNYIGEGYLTTQNIKDKLNISLGRDKSIIISRNQNLNETSKPSFFGNEVSQKFAYTIDIRNSKDLPINLTIYDQLPVIANKAISLDDEKYTGADYDKETGLLTWQVNLKAKEVKQIPFSFIVKYPNNKAGMIIGL